MEKDGKFPRIGVPLLLLFGGLALANDAAVPGVLGSWEIWESKTRLTGHPRPLRRAELTRGTWHV
jgi:hypothetical protein